MSHRGKRCLGAVSIIVMVCPVASRASVCEDPGTFSYVSGTVVEHDESALDAEPGTTGQLNQSVQMLVQGPRNLAFGYAHRYTKFDFEGIDPQTNAHLHAAAFPVHWRRADLRRNFRAAIAPVLSTSSNVLGHPQKYTTDTLQLALAFVWQKRLSEVLAIRYGACGDDRFGRYRIFPVAGLEWQPRADWKVDLGFPTSSVTWKIRENLSTGVSATPDGSEWHVMDRGFDAESRLRHESYVIEWMLALNAGPHFSVSAGLGRQLRNHFEMTLQSGEIVETEGKDVDRVRAEVRWQF
jgi:hypothetical protein